VAKSKTILITGDIGFEEFGEFHRECTDALKTTKTLDLLISSEGGSSLAALAYYDLIKSMVKNGVAISGFAMGSVQSAATLIFLACPKRDMASSAWLMFHEDQYSDLETMSTTQAEELAGRARRFENQWLSLLEKSTGIPNDAWYDLHQGETWLDYDECKKLGILTEDK
jgi:ATP-dependent protease ClpP protease subunit